MMFLMMTLSVALGVLLSGIIGIVIVMNPTVLKWFAEVYMKQIEKVSKDLIIHCNLKERGSQTRSFSFYF